MNSYPAASTRRRVVFVTHTAQVSGAELVMLQLVRRALDEGRTVTVACPDGPLRSRLPAEVDILAIPLLGPQGERGLAKAATLARLAAGWLRTGRILRTELHGREGTVIVNSLFALPAVAVARIPRGAVWLVHDTLSSAEQRGIVWLSRRGIARAVAVSEPTAVPPRQLGIDVTVAHLGVEVPDFRVSRDVAATPVIGMMGALTPWKGHRVLLDAVSRMPAVRLEIAGEPFPGDEPYAEELRRRASEPDLAGRVVFLGRVDPLPTLRTWDVAVSASTSPEAGPLVALEAMSVGVPVVGTDHGGTSVLLGGGAGLLVPPGDPDALAAALHRILTDDDLRRSVTETARRRVEDNHDRTTTVPRMLEELLRA